MHVNKESSAVANTHMSTALRATGFANKVVKFDVFNLKFIEGFLGR